MPAKGREGSGYKMVLVVRGELRLTAGKAAVQVAHAAVMLVEAAMRHSPRECDAWRSEGQKKIAVIAPTLTEMEQLQRAARSKGLPTVFVEDAGLTEVPPGTRTVLGIGPGRSDVIDPITGHLPLL
ncbi:MAG TPA: peptidyl-tRNA hydrolase Pth2 [Thermoplasmata archaeon]|nr:peptidyl-tRNA hydrolase Pth2 [Thermoplasmata archaeon]